MRRQQEAEKALHDQTDLLPRTQVLIVFAALSFSLMICFIDQNGIGVTLPTIGKDLHGENTISWAGTSNLIGNTVCSVLYGRLSDIFGRKVVLLFSLVLLCISDIGCGVAQNPPMLYFFRALAGVSSGGVVSLNMIIVSDIVTLRDRGKYQGILGSFVGIGNIVGLFIAAAFVQKSTWRGFFYLLAPLVVCCGIVSFWLVPSNMRPDGLRENLQRVDFGGVISSAAGIILLLIPISGGGSYFLWDSPMVISMLVLGSCAVLIFVFVEMKIAALPMMPMRIYKNAVVVVILFQTFTIGAVYQAYLYYLPIYYQNARRWSPMKSATYTIPVVAGQTVGSIVSGHYITKLERYGDVIWAGFGLWTLGAGLTITFNRTTQEWVIVVILSIIGIGVGFVFQPSLIAIQAHCTKSFRAVVISNRNFYRCLGGACGLAISAAALQHSLKANLPPHYRYLSHSTYSLPENLPPKDADAIIDAYMKASRTVFILQVPLIGLGFIGCIFVKDRGLERPKEPGEESETSVEMQLSNDIAHDQPSRSSLAGQHAPDPEKRT
ncbi:conserved hypothetical protein [Uncinocarpus reesii 1704]|uniref:Major facilitator superfamily (MFS) profile domain-containing protein n=1 Tax=Uncinocarpus reesii (strain UAMH 1704) TaxID=336963 RepID=C4JEJ5_UNCRE|nr:uncharacterized protein UREG_00834 [Uncinocarpus reesii 1704]EEP75987.1 conserved hypothetical protein [Uncinocarpus reesii 1704]